jgi:hypothetical protein
VATPLVEDGGACPQEQTDRQGRREYSEPRKQLTVKQAEQAKAKERQTTCS